MWIIRILNGPQAGQILKLQNGANSFGRGESCNFTLASTGVSKLHCQIDVYDHEVIINDQNSRNGTFVNGLKVKSQRLNSSDKISLYDVILEIAQVDENQFNVFPMNSGQQPQGQPAQQQAMHHQQHGNLAMQAEPFANGQAQPEMNAQGQATPQKQTGLKGLIQTYVDDVILPGVYKLSEMMEFKWVLGIFMGVFLIIVTVLSTIPLVRILKSSIEQESQRRALTIARTLAQVNRPALMQGLDAALTVDIAKREPGVEKAYIISHVDGNIIAPSSMAGRYPKDKFINTARHEAREAVGQINSDTIGALVPIEFYNSNTGTQNVTAYAVIIYNMGSLAIDDGRTVSLFIQTLLIASLIGAVVYFFLFNLIKFPILQLNKQIDTALKERHANIEVKFLFPELQNLISNVSSTLNRAISGGGDELQQNNFEYDRNNEMVNLVQLIGFPAMSINAVDETITAVNGAFEETTGIKSPDIVYNTVEGISDQSLKLSLLDLIERVAQAPDQLATNELEFSGINYEILAQAVYGKEAVAYYMIVVLPKDEGEAAE